MDRDHGIRAGGDYKLHGIREWFAVGGVKIIGTGREAKL